MPRGVPSPESSPATTRPGEPRTAARERWLVLGVCLAALAPYARTLGFGWLEVSDAPLTATTSLESAWRTGGIGAALLPLEIATGSALPSRLIALALHAGSSLVVLALARRLGLARGAAAFVAVLFAVHPLGAEGVAWLSQRSVLLGTFLLLSGALLLLDAPPWRARRLALAVPVLALGLACEPRTFAWVPWLLLARRWPAPWTGPTSLRHDVALVSLGALGWVDPGSGALSELVESAPAAVGGLFRLWVWPAGLTPTHPAYAGAPAPALWSAAQWLLVLLLATVLLRLRQRA